MSSIPKYHKGDLLV